MPVSGMVRKLLVGPRRRCGHGDQEVRLTGFSRRKHALTGTIARDDQMVVDLLHFGGLFPVGLDDGNVLAIAGETFSKR